MESTQPRNVADDGWPWSCTRCDRTVYHDTLVCEECDGSAGFPGAASAGEDLRDWTDWMRRQSYARFLGIVAAIAGAEVLLTMLWLVVLFPGTFSLPV